MRRRPHIPLRQLVYIGCEGASEASYAAFLQDLVNAAGLSIHLKIEELGPGAGDPLSRIEMAVRRIKRHSQRRIPPVASFALLDEDQATRDPQRADQARRVAVQNKIMIVWQKPCFEALLLRHLPDHAMRRPPDTSISVRAIEKEWTDYKKPMDRAALARRLDLEAVLRAATVEPELTILLRALGLLL
jgi:hypothetical protein